MFSYWGKHTTHQLVISCSGRRCWHDWLPAFHSQMGDGGVMQRLVPVASSAQIPNMQVPVCSRFFKQSFKRETVGQILGTLWHHITAVQQQNIPRIHKHNNNNNNTTATTTTSNNQIITIGPLDNKSNRFLRVGQWSLVRVDYALILRFQDFSTPRGKLRLIGR